MTKIVLQSWRTDLKKVSADKILAHEVGLGLAKGHQVVEALIGGQPGVIHVPPEQAQRILERLREVGVVCELGD